MELAKEKKERACFVPFILSKGKFLYYMCSIAMYSVSNTPSEYTYFTYQKTLLHALFFLFLKSPKAFSISLIIILLKNISSLYWELDCCSANYVVLGRLSFSILLHLAQGYLISKNAWKLLPRGLGFVAGG